VYYVREWADNFAVHAAAPVKSGFGAEGARSILRCQNICARKCSSLDSERNRQIDFWWRQISASLFGLLNTDTAKRILSGRQQLIDATKLRTLHRYCPLPVSSSNSFAATITERHLSFNEHARVPLQWQALPLIGLKTGSPLFLLRARQPEGRAS
jgi:hypothetical protein